MKDYPSIPRSSGQTFTEIPNAYLWDKVDGSCMRSEYSKKKGWHKHGKRNGLIDNSNPHLIVVPELFMKTLAEPLEKLVLDNKWTELLVFYEFWGEKSFAGCHVENDPKFLTVFDAVPNKQGFMGPKEFLKTFTDKVETPKFFGIHNFTRGLVDRIKTGEFEGPTFEGVVAKAGTKHDIVRGKAKTQRWIDRVIEIHGAEKSKQIIES